MVRNRINLITGAKKGDNIWLSPFITSVLHVIFMQHKINQVFVKQNITNNSNSRYAHQRS